MARPLPAFLYLDPSMADLRVAALSLLDRLIVAVHRAGFGPITVIAEGPLPPLPRAQAWRIPFTVLAEPPPRRGPTLVARTTALVQPVDLRPLLESPARLVTSNGDPLPIGVIGEGDDEAWARLDRLPARTAAGVAGVVRNREEARAVERALWRSLTSSSDGWVDKVFNRPLGRPLSRWLIHTSVTPNAVSLAATAIGLAAAGLFAWGGQPWVLLAAILFQVSAVVDCVDGDIARAVFKESPLGKWLDLVGDQVVHIAVFGGIALGLWRTGAGSHVAILGIVAMAGAALSFLAVLRRMRRRGAAAGSGRMQAFLDAATTRDFSVLVLALAAVDRLEWFLWLAAIGSHAFWVAVLLA